MFRRCASGSCDFVPFSIDDLAWIVVDIGLSRRHGGSLREKLDNLAWSRRFRDNMLQMSIVEGCDHKEFNSTRWFRQLEVRLDMEVYSPLRAWIHKSAVWSGATLKRAGHN